MGRGTSELQKAILRHLIKTAKQDPRLLTRWFVSFAVKRNFFNLPLYAPGAFRFAKDINQRKYNVSICRALNRLERRGLISRGRIHINCIGRSGNTVTTKDIDAIWATEEGEKNLSPADLKETEREGQDVKDRRRIMRKVGMI